MFIFAILLGVVCVIGLFYSGMLMEWNTMMAKAGKKIIESEYGTDYPKTNEFFADYNLTFTHAMPWHLYKTYKKYKEIS